MSTLTLPESDPEQVPPIGQVSVTLCTVAFDRRLCLCASVQGCGIEAIPAPGQSIDLLYHQPIESFFRAIN